MILCVCTFGFLCLYAFLYCLCCLYCRAMYCIHSWQKSRLVVAVVVVVVVLLVGLFVGSGQDPQGLQLSQGRGRRGVMDKDATLALPRVFQGDPIVNQDGADATFVVFVVRPTGNNVGHFGFLPRTGFRNAIDIVVAIAVARHVDVTRLVQVQMALTPLHLFSTGFLQIGNSRQNGRLQVSNGIPEVGSIVRPGEFFEKGRVGLGNLVPHGRLGEFVRRLLTDGLDAGFKVHEDAIEVAVDVKVFGCYGGCSGVCCVHGMLRERHGQRTPVVQRRRTKVGVKGIRGGRGGLVLGRVRQGGGGEKRVGSSRKQTDVRLSLSFVSGGLDDDAGVDLGRRKGQCVTATAAGTPGSRGVGRAQQRGGYS